MPIVTCLLKPTDISLRVFSLVQLYTAIYLGGDLFDTAPGRPRLEAVPSDLAKSAVKKCFQQPMMRLAATAGRVHYYSAIPLSVAAMLQQSPQVVADWMVDAVVSDTQRSIPLRQSTTPIDLVDLQVDLQVTDRGYIEWILSGVLLEKWLHHAAGSITHLPIPAIVPPAAFLNSERLWLCCHAYARCDAWLRQADTMLSITISDSPEPNEQLILLDLMRVIDQLADVPLPFQSIFYIDALDTVRQAFEHFWQSDLYQLGKPVSAFRLGLVMLIKNLLARLLQTGFGVKGAPKF